MSDYAFAGYKPVCQRKLMQAMAHSQLGTAAARTFPPSLLEWTANRQQASMALDLHCFNGVCSTVQGHGAGQGQSQGDHPHEQERLVAPAHHLSLPR